MTKKYHKKGFSLIELVVVIAIILIMTLLLFAVSFDDAKKNDVDVAARQVTVALRQAQNAALTGRKVGDDRTCRFIFNASGGGYSIGYDYYNAATPDTGGGPGNTPDNVVSCADAESGHFLEPRKEFGRGVSFVNTYSYSFDVPHGKVIDTATANEIVSVQTITVETDGIISNICLHPSGRIDEVGDVPCS